LLRSIQEYCRHRKNETPLTPSLALVEYNAGLQLSSLYSLKHNNNLQHAFRPSPTYSYIMAILRKHKLYEQDVRQQLKNAIQINEHEKQFPQIGD